MANAIIWFRRDLRLTNHPALQAAIAAGYAPIPLYIHAPEEDGDWPIGAASAVWLDRSLRALDQSLNLLGSRLIVRHGRSIEVLQDLIDQAKVEAVFWHRLYEPLAIERDSQIKQSLKARGIHAESFNGSLLVEPWQIKTGSGDPYRVFTPFWKNAKQHIEDIRVQAAPESLPPVDQKIRSEQIDALKLIPSPRWDRSFWQQWQPGEIGAQDLLDAFLDGAVDGYKTQRNYPDRIGSSKLSPHLHFGEISPQQIINTTLAKRWPAKNQPDIDHYFSELGWREFNHHLLYHFPHTPNENLNPRFAEFAWAEVDENLLAAWQRGQTGVPIVDAGMRELWSTGWMHNRIRMVVASFLTKNLRYHWLHGARWFWDTLLDADLANNTQGWQWTAGTGADAAPYFRIFSPVAQTEKFDAKGVYIRRWVPELAKLPDKLLAEPWTQPQLLKTFAPDYPIQPIVDLKASRQAALQAYSGPKQILSGIS